jgi:hypothetical protein
MKTAILAFAPFVALACGCSSSSGTGVGEQQLEAARGDASDAAPGSCSAASAGTCSTARAYLSCTNGGVTESCLSDDLTKCPGTVMVSGGSRSGRCGNREQWPARLPESMRVERIRVRMRLGRSERTRRTTGGELPVHGNYAGGDGVLLLPLRLLSRTESRCLDVRTSKSSPCCDSATARTLKRVKLEDRFPFSSLARAASTMKDAT